MSPDTLVPAPPILVGPLFALLLFWLGLALGDRVLKLLRVPAQAFDVWERGFIAVTLGVAVLQLLPCALAACGWMTPFGVRIGSGLVLAAALPDMVRAARRIVLELKPLRLRALSAPVTVWLLLVACMLAILLVQASVFRSFGDDDGYHLSGPKRWLAAGTLVYLPSFTHTNASLGFEMLYAIALSFSDVIGAKMLHFGAGVLTLLGVVLVGRRLGSVYAGAITASLLLVTTPLINLPLLFTVAYADFGSSWMAVASVLGFLAWRAQPEAGLLTLFALCAGFAGSFKFTSLGLAIAWAPALIYEARAQGLSWPRCAALLTRFGAISALPVSPWLLRNLLVTGNPIYPILASLIPTRDWSVDHAAIFGRYVRYYSWGVAAGARLSEAARLQILLGCEAAIAAAVGLAVWRVRRPELRSILVFAGSFCLMSVALTGMIFRYWLPALACGLLALAVAITGTWRSALRHWLGPLLLMLAIFRVGKERSLAADAEFAFGLKTFAQQHPDDSGWQMWRYINHETPRDARVLAASFYTSTGASSFGGFWSDRPFYVTDSHLQTYIQLSDWPSFVESVQRAGITHVLIYRTQENAGRHGFQFRAAENEYAFCRRLANEYGTKVAEFQPLQLYEVAPQRALREAKSHTSWAPL